MTSKNLKDSLDKLKDLGVEVTVHENDQTDSIEEYKEKSLKMTLCFLDGENVIVKKPLQFNFCLDNLHHLDDEKILNSATDIIFDQIKLFLKKETIKDMLLEVKNINSADKG